MLQVGRNALARAATCGMRAGGAKLPPAAGCVAAVPSVLLQDGFRRDIGHGGESPREWGASRPAGGTQSRATAPGRAAEERRGHGSAAAAGPGADSSFARLWRWASEVVGLLQELMGDLFRGAQLGLLFLPSALLAGPSFLATNGARQRWYRLFVATLEVAGPTFVKLGALVAAGGRARRARPDRVPPPEFAGQWASTRPDLFPPDFCDALCRLHDGVESHSLAESQRLIEAELGAPLGTLFRVLNPRPLGTGSIAQVYEAVLCGPEPRPGARCQLRPPTRDEAERARAQGRHVAVKVQHPGVRGRIAQDLRLLHRAVAAVSLIIPSTRWFALREVRSGAGRTHAPRRR